MVLLVVDSTDDGQQRLLNSCLKLSVAPGSDCRDSKGEGQVHKVSYTAED